MKKLKKQLVTQLEKVKVCQDLLSTYRGWSQKSFYEKNGGVLCKRWITEHKRFPGELIQLSLDMNVVKDTNIMRRRHWVLNKGDLIVCCINDPFDDTGALDRADLVLANVVFTEGHMELTYCPNGVWRPGNRLLVPLQ